MTVDQSECLVVRLVGVVVAVHGVDELEVGVLLVGWPAPPPWRRSRRSGWQRPGSPTGSRTGRRRRRGVRGPCRPSRRRSRRNRPGRRTGSRPRPTGSASPTPRPGCRPRQRRRRGLHLIAGVVRDHDRVDALRDGVGDELDLPGRVGSTTPEPWNCGSAAPNSPAASIAPSLAWSNTAMPVHFGRNSPLKSPAASIGHRLARRCRRARRLGVGWGLGCVRGVGLGWSVGGCGCSRSRRLRCLRWSCRRWRRRRRRHHRRRRPVSQPPVVPWSSSIDVSCRFVPP